MIESGNTRRMISKYPFKYEKMAASDFFSMDKASIYIHIPFCVKRCHYCTYVTKTGSTNAERENYVQALIKDILAFDENHIFPEHEIESIYFGGGTPGLLTDNQITRILDAVKTRFKVQEPLKDLCMEFDPSIVTDEKLEVFKKHGFTRLSLGVQSFDDTVLKASNRSHNADTARKAIRKIKEHGIKNFNIDLIYPLQCQNMSTWKEDLLETISMEPAEITAHVLEVWPGTKLEQLVKEGVYKLPSFEEEIRMTNEAYDILEKAGFKRWSNCGYYHPDRTSHYSLFMDYYWRSWPMIGFGVSAQSVVGKKIWTNTPEIDDYLQRVNNHLSPMNVCTTMSTRQEMLRFVIRGFKACYISKNEFYNRFGVELSDVFSTELNYLKSKEWIFETENSFNLTRDGQVFDRDVYTVFYTEDDMKAPEKTGQVWLGLSLSPDEDKEALQLPKTTLGGKEINKVE